MEKSRPTWWKTTEKKNKRGKVIIAGPRRIATCTLKAIKEKLSENNIDVSFGTILSLRPFFITFATEKEMALCLCKIFLNARPQAKKDQNVVTDESG